MNKTVSLAVAAGIFCAGYICGTTVAGTQKLNCVKIPAVDSSKSVTKVPVTSEKMPIPVGMPVVERSGISTSTRLAVLDSIGHQKNVFGSKYHCNPVFLMESDILNSEFAFVFGLNTEEVDKISQALKIARDQMLNLQRSSLTSNFDPGKNCLTLTFPSIPRRGGEVYDQANAVMRSVLGPDRERYFDKFSAEAFDRAFDGFGTVEKTVVVTPVVGGSGTTYYTIEEKTSNSSSTSRMPLDMLRKSFPLIASQVEASFGK